MKKEKVIKITLIIITVLIGISIPITLHFTLPENAASENQTIDLGEKKIEYLAKVENMTKITKIEAETIKNDLQTKIINETSKWNLKENIDYIILNLDKIISNTNLSEIDEIELNSIPSSTKATGKLIVSLNVQEDITNRINNEIIIYEYELEGLSQDRAEAIQDEIHADIHTMLNNGQPNEENTDYRINNLELIKETAKFEEYNNKIIVKGISNHLIGEFLIKFKVDSD